MMKKSIIMSVCLGLTFASSAFAKLPQSNQTLPSVSIHLPQTINYQGQTFYLKFQTSNSSEYYLKNEKDFDWTKLITINYVASNNLNEYKNNMETGLRQQNLTYRSTLLKGNGYLWQVAYPPIQGQTSVYESDISYNTVNSCGIVGMIYAEHITPNGKNSQAQSIFNNLSKNQNSFINQAKPILSNVQCN